MLEGHLANDARAAVRRAFGVRRMKPVERQHAQPAGGQLPRRRASRGAGAGDDDVEVGSAQLTAAMQSISTRAPGTGSAATATVVRAGGSSGKNVM